MRLENIDRGIDLQALYNSDRTAYSNLFNLYYTGLCWFAERIVGEDFAEDIVGDVFLKLWEGNTFFESELHLKAFLYRAVKNACLNQIKMKGRAEHRHIFYYAEKDDHEETFLVEVTRAEALRELYLAINNLPPQAQKIIKLTYLESMSNKEVADHLGLSIQTVKNQKIRGLGLLRKRLHNGQYILLSLLSYFGALQYFIW